jgi:hypothetical protein
VRWRKFDLFRSLNGGRTEKPRREFEQVSSKQKKKNGAIKKELFQRDDELI